MNALKNKGDWNPVRPNPDDFDNYFPWACTQLSVEFRIVIIKTFLAEYVSVIPSYRSKKKRKNISKTPSDSDSEESVDSDPVPLVIYGDEKKIFVETIYDGHMNLIKLKFLKNKVIPRIVMKIIGLIIPFHKHLTSISINSGLHMEAIYEISKFLPMSRITEICLDHTFLVEANYYVLLDQNSLKHLSLAKCKINDVVVKTIAFKLTHPYPASQNLSALNLATNRITDVGAKYLAEALRSNRKLCYLNLADNMITDKGARSIFDILGEFPLTVEEMKVKKGRHLAYLKERMDLVLKTAKELRVNDYEKKTTKKKHLKPLKSKKKILEKESATEYKTKSMLNADAIYNERAEHIVQGILGSFEDPFDANNTESRDKIVYCHGNNTICYLNLAYNDLTNISIRKLHQVISTQKSLNRNPKGLINVVIEGNFLPELCKELIEIDDLLESGLVSYTSISVNRRRPSSKRSV